MICTWKDCNKKAEKPQLDRNENQWANLCEEHNKKLDEVIDNGVPSLIISAWIKASGGAKVMASKMFRSKK